MLARMKIIIGSLVICSLVVCFLSSCGISSPTGAQEDSPLEITFSKHASPATLVSDVRDAQTVDRLYQAALALRTLPGALFSCPADDSGVYHLTFTGAEFHVHHMDINSSGCRFLTITDTDDLRMMDDAFVSLFTRTAGLPTLDPTFP